LERKGRRRQNGKEEQLQNKAKKSGGRMVEEDTEDTNHARPQQQPFVEVDTPVAKPSAGNPQQKGKTSATNSAETLGIFRVSSGGEMTKARGLLPEAEEDVRLTKKGNVNCSQ
jgi:hypothetical protein